MNQSVLVFIQTQTKMARLSLTDTHTHSGRRGRGRGRKEGKGGKRRRRGRRRCGVEQVLCRCPLWRPPPRRPCPSSVAKVKDGRGSRLFPGKLECKFSPERAREATTNGYDEAQPRAAGKFRKPLKGQLKRKLASWTFAQGVRRGPLFQ